MKKIYDFSKKNIGYILVLLFSCLFGFLIPYTHDDWFWGTSWGLQHLLDNFDNVNGRYFGNYLAYALTRSRVIRALLYGIVFTLITFLINKIVSDKKKYTTIILILLLTLELPVFIQTVSWTAGFVNYVVPMIGVLAFIYLNKNIFNDKETFYKYTSIIMLPLGIFNSLFMENISIYNIIFVIGLIVYYLIKTKKIHKEHILYLLGCIIGTAIMFSNSAYGFISNGADTFGNRSIDSGNFIVSFAHKYLHIFSPDLIFNNYILVVVLSFVLFKILHSLKEKSLFSKLIQGYVIFYSVYATALNFINIGDPYFRYINYLNGILTFIYFIIIGLIIILYIPKEKRTMLLMVYISIILVIMPLFVVNPVQSRCMFPPYVLLMLLAVLFVKEAKIENKYILICLYIVLSILVIFRLYVYTHAYVVDINRINYIKLHDSEPEITISELPHKEHFFISTPANSDYAPKFKEFYHIKNSQNVIFKPCE